MIKSVRFWLLDLSQGWPLEPSLHTPRLSKAYTEQLALRSLHSYGCRWVAKGPCHQLPAQALRPMRYKWSMTIQGMFYLVHLCKWRYSRLWHSALFFMESQKGFTMCSTGKVWPAKFGSEEPVFRKCKSHLVQSTVHCCLAWLHGCCHCHWVPNFRYMPSC